MRLPRLKPWAESSCPFEAALIWLATILHFMAGRRCQACKAFPKKQIPLGQNFSGSFEDEDDASAEGLAKVDLVADFGVRLRRA
jgi:hypothetical protein